MTEPRKTPRTDAAELPWVANTQVACYGPCVKSDFARALEIETQELAEALRICRNALYIEETYRKDGALNYALDIADAALSDAKQPPTP